MVEKRVLFLGILIGFLILLWWIEHLYKKNVFTPSKVQMKSPVETHEDLMLNGKHVRIFPNLDEKLWVLFCHGSNGNLSHRQYMVEMCRLFRFNLCVYDYPGYGMSKGSPTAGGVQSTSLEVFQWLMNEKGIPAENIVVWGESLGGNPATLIASKYNVRTLVLFGTFSSLPDALTDQLDLWSKLMGNVCRAVSEPLSSKSLISDVKCPVVIVHSREDTIIPFSNARTLYQAVTHDYKYLIPITGDHALPHMDARAQMALFKILRSGSRIDADKFIQLRDQVEKIQTQLRETDFYHQRYLPQIKAEK